MATVSKTVSLINEMANLLREKGFVVSTKPLESVIDQVEMWTPSGKHPLRYSLRGLEFVNITPQYIRGNEWLDKLTLRLDADVTVTKDEFTFENVKELTINIHYDAQHCDGFPCKGAWHLDLHIPASQTQSKKTKKTETVEPFDVTKFMHPDFHFHHGGNKLNALESYGNIILLDTPRVMHHPLDIILAIDFVVSNFVFAESWNDLRSEVRYKKIIEQAQESWWKPYYEALGSYWISKANNKAQHAKDNIALSKKLNPHLI
ncbi:hypothetical protein [Vibrio harveyi]|uniref:hypothetical protein n=1 Tax=Vibrio harveyi TaxID=669 RepID=UPI003CF9F997